MLGLSLVRVPLMPTHAESLVNWPALHPVTAPMLPGEAWKCWQAGTITREQFTDVMEAWSI